MSDYVVAEAAEVESTFCFLIPQLSELDGRPYTQHGSRKLP